jgi:hypothetical protein
MLAVALGRGSNPRRATDDLECQIATVSYDVQKVCGKCQKVKRLNDFHKASASVDGHHWWCRDCMKTYWKRYYKENRRHEIQRASGRITGQRKKTREHLYDYLLSNPCTDCKETDVVVLEFDHVRGKSLRMFLNL